MKPTMNVPVKTISVPLDMLLDILEILYRNDVPNRINSINADDRILWLDVKLATDHPKRKDIVSNIDALLGDYHIYVNGNADDMNFSSYTGNNF